ncbi:MAG: archease [Candidatus Ranarchaeia archaeon]|jgi:SHS2 domain-containing protein
MLVGKKRFEFQEHVADEIVIAYGTSVEEAFENAALGLFEVMTDTNTVEPNHEDVFEVVYSQSKIEKIEKRDHGFRLKGHAWGEIFQQDKHPSRTEVKAVTYHEMEISQNDLVQVKFLLDL